MRAIALLALILGFVLPAQAHDLGNQAPPKPVVVHEPPPVEPEVVRQGGDTIADAVELWMPSYNVEGTTVGYTDDYDEVCPYTQSTSPDVVYTFMLDWPAGVNIDMYGSAYDTKIYVYDENLALVACNDDFYPDYVSKIENMPAEAGVRYYLVVDGYGGDAGNYLLDLDSYPAPYLDCPPGSQLENEPELVDGYVDTHNGGCNTDPVDPPYQHLDSLYFCGISGWYQFDGVDFRDTDWFTVTLPASGSLTIEADALWESHLFELGPPDCDTVGVLQSVTFGPMWPHEMTVTGDAGSDVWIWVGPTAFAPPGGGITEYEYVLYFDTVVGVENHSWSDVKALFD